jgi:GxxExxY protein
MNKKLLNDLTYEILGAVIEVHRNLGPGLLESIYHKCLKHEFTLRKLKYSSEFLIPVFYKGAEMDTELRCDFVVEDLIVLEIKSVSEIHPVFEAQVLTYMKLLEKPKGILINFNCVHIFKEGQQTFVNEIFRNLPKE